MTVEDNQGEIKLHNQPMAEWILQQFKMKHWKPTAMLFPAGLD